MKQLTLNQQHINYNGKMVPFAGFEMPVQYEGVTAEHLHVRNSVGVFDVSHMGEFFISGNDALALIQKITSNDAATLTIGKAQYSCMPNAIGGIVDDLIVYRLADNNYMLVVNASNIEKDWNWIQENNNFNDVTLVNKSDDYSLLAIQGPKAIEAMQSLTPINLSEIKYYHFEQGEFAGLQDIIISATGYTGSGGFEIYCHNNQVIEVWNKVFEAGKSFDIKPIGLAARDTLRLEMGFCLYGNDINDTTSPLEAGLGWITKFTKNFTNSETLKQQKENGVTKKLIGFELLERGIPRHDYPINDKDGYLIGIVTSGTQAPSLNKAIGMGYVTTEFSGLDCELFIEIRGKNVAAKVVKMPFK